MEVLYSTYVRCTRAELKKGWKKPLWIYGQHKVYSQKLVLLHSDWIGMGGVFQVSDLGMIR